MGGRLETHIEPVVSAMERVRGQWASVKSSIEDDHARIDQIRGALRGALGPTMLTGQQGAAFDNAIDRYREAARAAWEALGTMIRDLDTQTDAMRWAAQDADGKSVVYNERLEEILDHILPDIPGRDLLMYGEGAVHEAVNANRSFLIGMVNAAEQLAVQAMDDAIGGVETVISGMASDLQWCAKRWVEIVHTASGVLGTTLNVVDTAVKIGAEAFEGAKVGKLLDELDNNAGYGWVTIVIGILADFGAEKDWNPFNAVKDVAGGGLGWLGGYGVGGAVTIQLTVMQLTSAAASWVQGAAANVLAAPGTLLNTDLGQLSKNWQTTADDLNLGHVLDDWGAVGMDMFMTDATCGVSLVDPQLVSASTVNYWHSQTLSAAGVAGHDTLRLGVGMYEFKVNAQATIVSDSAAASNYIIQRSPFPPSVKAASAMSATEITQNMTDVSNLVTKGKLPPNTPPAYQAMVAGETATMAFAEF